MCNTIDHALEREKKKRKEDITIVKSYKIEKNHLIAFSDYKKSPPLYKKISLYIYIQ